ncbi:MAG: hydrogenase maturation protease [Candidatus Helarchaeota archaeon]
MSSKEEIEKIKEILNEKIPSDARLALIGIGNNQRQDDEAGLAVIQNLMEKIEHETGNLKLIEGIGAPEYYIHEIDDWKPTHLLMIDAADMGLIPGSIRIITRKNLARVSLSSHSLSKNTLLDFLISFNPDLKILILGIQAESIEIEQKMTERVRNSVNTLSNILEEIILKKIK